MALIKCPDCGKMFSEYAECCPDCGCPVEQPHNQNKTCPECGQEVDASVMVCPNCAFPFDNTTKKGAKTRNMTIDEPNSEKRGNRMSKHKITKWKRYIPIIIISIAIFAVFAVFNYLSQRRYSEMSDFKGGLALVKHNNLYGYINHMGEEAIECQYEKASNFEFGLACVKKNGKFGIINSDGREVINCEYDNISIISESILKIEQNGRWGLLGIDRKEIVPCKYEEISDFNEGYAVAKLEKYGTIDINGNVVVPFMYDFMGYWHDGIYAVSVNIGGSIKQGLVDIRGCIAVPVKYKEIYNYNDGIALVSEDGGWWGYVPLYGRDYILNYLDKASLFYNGFAYVKQYDEWYIINEEGRRANNRSYDEIAHTSVGHYFQVWRKDKCGLLDVDGGYLYGCNYADIDVIYKDKDDLILSYREKDDGLYGIIKLDGWKTPPTYDYVDDFNGKFAKVKKDNLWGLINTKGELLGSCWYEDITIFENGLIRAKLNGKDGIIDITGKEIIPFVYDAIYCFSDGLAKAKRNGKWGYINIKGDEVIKCQYVLETEFK